MTESSRARLVIPILALGLLAGCGDSGLDDATRARVVTLGDSAAMTLVRTLGGRLNGHLAASGPAEAIAFCAGEAQSITDSVSSSLGPGWSVRRTTSRTRNPRNAPDSLDAVALQYFQMAVDARADMIPENYVLQSSSGDYRYYMPLQLGSMCLECHGPLDRLEPEVRRVLTARYPADQATGYGQGDFRGVVQVTVPAQAVR